MKKSQVFYGRGYLPRRHIGLPRRKNKFVYWQGRQREEISLKKKIIFILILFLILAIIYILFLSQIFKIKKIMVSGNRIIVSEEIKESLNKFFSEKFLYFFDKNNIFLAKQDRIKEIILKDFPRISLVEVNKNIFKRTIDLKIIERKEIGIFCRKDCYYIDENGVIFEKAPQTSGTLILSIKDNSEGEVEIGKNALDKEFMTEFISLRGDLLNQLGLKVLDFIIEADASKDLRVDTNEGWYILFDRARDLKSQLQALTLVLEEKIKEGRKNLEYIDLRIESRIYYK